MKKLVEVMIGLFFVLESLSSQVIFTSDSSSVTTTNSKEIKSIECTKKVKIGKKSYSIIQDEKGSIPDSFSMVFNNSDSLRLLEPFPESDLDFWDHGVKTEWRNFETLESILRKYLFPALKEKWRNYWKENTMIVNFTFYFDLSGKTREIEFSYMNILKNDLPISIIDKICTELVASNFGLNFNPNVRALKRANWISMRYAFYSNELSK